MNRMALQQPHTNKGMRPQTIAGICLMASMLVYVLVLFMTTMTLAEHKSVAKDMRELETEIAEIETQFVQQAHELSVAYAQTRGLQEAIAVTFISDGELATSVAFAAAE